MEVKKIICIIQARSSSSRLPNKVLLQINKNSVLDIVIKRLKKSKKINQIIVSTTKNKLDNKIVGIAKKNNVDYYRGESNNVLKRFYSTAKKFKGDTIIRVNADCPIIDPRVLDLMIDYYKKNNFDFISNAINPTFPDGLDVAIFSYKILKKANLSAKSKYDKENVTSIMKSNNLLTSLYYSNKKNLSNFRLCLDEFKDYEVIKFIFNKKKDIFFKWQDAVKILKQNKEIYELNSGIQRNEGAYIDKQKKLWIRSKNIIPGGNMMLTKRPDNILKSNWPAYFTKAKGCFIWDLDGKKYVDICYMGVGTNMLGYSNNRVDSKVKKVIDKGTCSTLNSREDLDLAKKIIDIHPWFDAVRFGRGGADTNSIAIRLARSFTKKNKIAICGYHGWHDWYLSANYKSKSLDNFLFRNVAIQGVPTDQKNQSFVFEFNNLNSFYKLMKNNKFCAVIMEVERNIKPNIKFLKMIRNYCTKNNIVLIFDECSSGFREVLGGIHKKYKVYPDLAMFSKSIGNGYPITVLAGKSRILNESYNTFISSTYWSERVGPTAALASINEMERIKSWKLITQKGKYIKNKIFNLSKKYKINLKLNDSISIINFKIFGKYDHVVYKNFISQEMLKKNFICNDTIYISVAHTKKIINKYLKELETIFKKISVYEKNEELFVKLEQDISNIEFFKRFN